MLIRSQKLSNPPGKEEYTNKLIAGDALKVLPHLWVGNSNKCKMLFIDPPTIDKKYSLSMDNEYHTNVRLIRQIIDKSKPIMRDDGVYIFYSNESFYPYYKTMLDSLLTPEKHLGTIHCIEDISGKPSSKMKLSRVSYFIIYYNNKEPSINNIYEPTFEMPNRYYYYIKKVPTKTELGEYGPLGDHLIPKFFREYENYTSGGLGSNFVNFMQLMYAKSKKFRKYIDTHSDRIVRIRSLRLNNKAKAHKDLTYGKIQLVDEGSPVYMTRDTNDQIKFTYRLSNLMRTFHECRFGIKSSFRTFFRTKDNVWADYWSWNKRNYKEGRIVCDDSSVGKKPELILQRLVELFTNRNDLILDPLAGTFTMCAVAHKMHRKWIGVEIREDLINRFGIKRMNHVVDGSDVWGATHLVNWTGGGDFEVLVYSE